MNSSKKPTPEQIQRLGSLLTTSEHVRYFFHRLENPEWIPPLDGASYFSNPPESSAWPQSEYLVRMADKAPEQVMQVIEKVDTSNLAIQSDFIEAALRMPAEQAARIVPILNRWLRSASLFMLVDRVGALVVALASKDQGPPAFQLAEALLEVTVDPRFVGHDRALGLGSLAAGRVGAHEYEEIVQAVMPELIQTDWRRALQLLCGKLKDVLRIEGRLKDEDDYSSIWMEDVESTTVFEDFKRVLSVSIRQTAEYVLDNAQATLDQVVESLEGWQLPIYWRIAAHLIQRAGAIDLATTRLTIKMYLSKSGMLRERNDMLQTFFPQLPEAQQREIIQFLATPPDASCFVQYQEMFHDHRATPEEVESYKRSEIRNALLPIAEYLQGEWADYYRQLCDELGPPPRPVRRADYPTTWVGPTSPRSRDELRAMKTQDIVQFLRDWRPSGTAMSPSPAGLGRELVEVVAEDPTRFVVSAEALKAGVHPTYLGHIVHGLNQGVARGTALDWAVTLDLLNYMTHHARDQVSPHIETVDEMDIDQTWEFARLETARLLATALNRDVIPFDLRAHVWATLGPLLDDPDPTAEYEAKHMEHRARAYNMAANSVRSQAMHAVIRYALWCARHLRPDSPRLEGAPMLEGLGEVRDVLDAHLDPSRDPSVAVRSVYGQYFPWLVLLSR